MSNMTNMLNFLDSMAGVATKGAAASLTAADKVLCTNPKNDRMKDFCQRVHGTREHNSDHFTTSDTLESKDGTTHGDSSRMEG